MKKMGSKQTTNKDPPLEGKKEGYQSEKPWRLEEILSKVCGFYL